MRIGHGGSSHALRGHKGLLVRYHKVCALCNQPLDQWHAASRCGREYQDRIDKELLERKRGTRS